MVTLASGCPALSKTVTGEELDTPTPPKRFVRQDLGDYGKQMGWSAIEGYPFSRAAIDKHGKGVAWAGFPEDFEAAGYSRRGEHWMSSTEVLRSIYRLDL